LVEIGTVEPQKFAKSANFPSPRVSRFESFESPVVDGKTISSWRQRERDMNAVDAVDRRDIPQSVFDKRAAKVAKMKEVDGG